MCWRSYLAAEDFEAGDIIADTYRVVRRIAKGGFGVVYEARHVRLGELRVAIKILMTERADSDEFVPRFRREAEIGASLTHPNIVGVTDWNTLPNGLPYFVMEYLEGENLAARMRAGPITIHEILHIVGHIVKGLAEAHRRGIVHRDLKPGNVFLCLPKTPTEFPLVKVLDFGISKLTSSRTLQTTGAKLLGTPRYMAPEQAKGDTARVGPKTDQFALAMITYEMFARRLPFIGETLESIVYNVVHAPPIPLKELAPDAPDDIANAIERALQKNPDRRFENVDDFYTALCGGEPTSDGDKLKPTVVLNPVFTGGAKRGQRPRDASALGRRWWLWLAGSVTFLAAAGLIWKTLPPTDGQQASPTFTQVARLSPTPSTTSKPPPTTRSTPRVTETPWVAKESAAVKARLDAVEEYYASGKYSEATRRARQALAMQNVPRAHKLIVMSACRQHDLGNAKAWFHHVAPQDRAKVRAVCDAAGIPL